MYFHMTNWVNNSSKTVRGVTVKIHHGMDRFYTAMNLCSKAGYRGMDRFKNTIPFGSKAGSLCEVRSCRLDETRVFLQQ